jgi:hypothetical protein
MKILHLALYHYCFYATELNSLFHDAIIRSNRKNGVIWLWVVYEEWDLSLFFFTVNGNKAMSNVV